jgi:thiol-disulfide isomerase/thioredoxin
MQAEQLAELLHCLEVDLCWLGVADNLMMNPIRGSLILFALILAPLLSGCRGRGQDPTGTWTGTFRNPSGELVAYTLVVTAPGGAYQGSWQNGEELIPSTAGGSWDGRTLRLPFDYYDGELVVTIEGDRLQGAFTRQWQRQSLIRQLEGRRGAPPTGRVAGGQSLTGDWVLAVGAPPNQRYWRASFQQEGAGLLGTLITVSGDWGSFTGRVDGEEFALSRFDGINSRLLKGRVRADGRFEGIVDLGLFDPVRPVVGERLDPGNQQSVANLPDPDNYTRVVNPAEPFRFAFPSLAAQMVSSTDERFRDKVVVISITGSWCPNCHEESPLLQQYYQKYGPRGLEVVGLAFEYTGEADRDLEQLRIFAARHQLTYPLLLAGTTDDGEIGRKLPQLVNFAAYPTTIFVGRDGLVRRIHTGFEGRATGERHRRLKADYEALIEQLLSE